jgi:protein-S-isoprenylcysteine O-methyltransferase Ste14
MALRAKLAGLMREGPSQGPVLELANGLLTVTFCAMVMAAYLTRSRVGAPARGFRERVLPMLIFLAGPAGVLLLQALGMPRRFEVVVPALVVALGGLALSLWALWHLRRSFSILAEARVAVITGPYRLVRHPLYLGEGLTLLGLCLRIGTLAALALWAAVSALQLVRARIEEEKLACELPDYDAYGRRTRFILPGLY